jgi:hypothetical protein
MRSFALMVLAGAAAKAMAHRMLAYAIDAEAIEARCPADEDV